MEIQYIKQYSPILGRDMEIKIYGHGGKPVLYIPCQDGRFYDFENFHMTDVWSPWINDGKAMVFSVDTIDIETWSDRERNPRFRITRYEEWIQYIVQELVPYMQDMVRRRGTPEENAKVLVTGCSLGATHAVNLYFRFPDLFDKLMALSGLYTAEYGFDDYMDELVYLNSPVHFLPNMPSDHPYIGKYNSNQGVICVGQGPWEMPQTTRELHNACLSKGIDIWVDYWGYDCAHDWDWWYKQTVYFLPFLIG